MRGMEISISTTSGAGSSLFYRLDSVRGLAADLPLGTRGEQRTQAASDDFMIVYDEYLARCHLFIGEHCGRILHRRLDMNPLSLKRGNRLAGAQWRTTCPWSVHDTETINRKQIQDSL